MSVMSENLIVCSKGWNDTVEEDVATFLQSIGSDITPRVVKKDNITFVSLQGELCSPKFDGTILHSEYMVATFFPALRALESATTMVAMDLRITSRDVPEAQVVMTSAKTLRAGNLGFDSSFHNIDDYKVS